VRFAAYLAFSIGFLVLCGNVLGVSTPLERSVSASHQFIVYGANTPLRGAVAEVAEKTKANVLNVLQQRDEWKIPVILNLQFPQANVPEIPATTLRFSQTGSGLKLQLDLTIFSDFDVQALRRQLLRVILLELMYRQSPNLPAGSSYIEPPDWLLEGLLAADPFSDQNAISAAASSLSADAKVMTVDKFLQQKFGLLDSPGQLLYRGYALAFLELLLNEPGGATRLATYINNLSRTSSDPMSDLRTYFPVVAGPEIEVVWKASVAKLATRQYELLTTAETERQLEQLVGSGKPEDVRPDTADLTKLVKKRISKSETIQLRQLKLKLTLLSAEANPILRTLVLEYEQVVQRLLGHKIKGATARLSALASKRERLRVRSSDIDDYMNWFEATKSGTTSGAFADYLRAAARSTEPRSRRRDPLSVYLDVLEEQF